MPSNSLSLGLSGRNLFWCQTACPKRGFDERPWSVNVISEVGSFLAEIPYVQDRNTCPRRMTNRPVTTITLIAVADAISDDTI